MSGAITRDQFIRAFDVLVAHFTGRQAIERAATTAGLQDFCMGSSPVAHELERQLAERCRAREDENGPWPEDSFGEDDISMALHWADQPLRDHQGRVLDQHPTTGEDIWAMWEATGTGPFRTEQAR